MTDTQKPPQPSIVLLALIATGRSAGPRGSPAKPHGDTVAGPGPPHRNGLPQGLPALHRPDSGAGQAPVVQEVFHPSGRAFGFPAYIFATRCLTPSRRSYLTAVVAFHTLVAL
jgi:hypothetical protein